MLIHGGPQGAWDDGWSFRWNAQVFASAGYVVFMPNPRGSIGWGQEFIDDINGDWGGRAYEDVMKGTDYAEALPYVEQGRARRPRARPTAATWSTGSPATPTASRRSCRTTASSTCVSMYGSTEELWFPDWEFKGPLLGQPRDLRAVEPEPLRARTSRRPTLVVHGELDYRVPLEQGLGMFTALQRRGVPVAARCVFPDENHWVLKPPNSVRWYDEVLGWLDRWTRP